MFCHHVSDIFSLVHQGFCLYIHKFRVIANYDKYLSGLCGYREFLNIKIIWNRNKSSSTETRKKKKKEMGRARKKGLQTTMYIFKGTQSNSQKSVEPVNSDIFPATPALFW